MSDVYDLDAVEVEAGLYECEVVSLALKDNKKGEPNHVVTLKVTDPIYEGLQVTQWIKAHEDNFSFQEMNKKFLRDFFNACSDGAESDFKLKYETDDEGNKTFPPVEGMLIGAYLSQKDSYTNIDRKKGFVPHSMMDSDDDSPFE